MQRRDRKGRFACKSKTVFGDIMAGIMIVAFLLMLIMA